MHPFQLQKLVVQKIDIIVSNKYLGGIFILSRRPSSAIDINTYIGNIIS